jgi:hypothetical protein
LEEFSASIFRKEDPEGRDSTLSEMSIKFYQTTWPYAYRGVSIIGS